MGDAEPQLMTVEDYFRLEETSPIRHEYVAGEVYAMSGATARHNRIAGNIFARLLPLARAGPCDAFMNDMRLEAASHSARNSGSRKGLHVEDSPLAIAFCEQGSHPPPRRSSAPPGGVRDGS